MKTSKAFLLHLSISAVIVACALAMVFLVWYPHPYFEIAGAWRVLQILIGVDLVLGPTLTLILYRPGKKGLVFDLVFIACIQLAALVYGLTTIYSERPYYTVFSVDRYVMLADRDIAADTVPADIAADRDSIGPLYAVAALPEDMEERQELLFELLDGAPDIEFRPDYWKRYADSREHLLARLRPAAELRSKPAAVAAELDAFLEKSGRPVEDFLYAPIQGKLGLYLTLIVDVDELKAQAVIHYDLLEAQALTPAAPEDEVTSPAPAEEPSL